MKIYIGVGRVGERIEMVPQAACGGGSTIWVAVRASLTVYQNSLGKYRDLAAH
jgi:hypothetical protein